MRGKSRTVLVVYGGVNPEHEISIITALQVMRALGEAGFGVLPLYISKEGEWLLGDSKFLVPETYRDLSRLPSWGRRVILSPDRGMGLLSRGWLGFGSFDRPVDVVFPVIHGRGGEDGSLQGLLELAGVPYVGCGVTASGVKIDKYIAKRVAESVGLSVVRDKLVVRGEACDDEELKYPIFVKPVGLGSSIGLTRVNKKVELKEAMEVAFCFDSRVMVEEAVVEAREINISLLGNGPYEYSVTEEPKASGEMLSFDDKYVGEGGKTRGMAGAKRLIPAPFDEKTLKQVQVSAVKLFRAIGGRGIARCDFLIDKKGKVYFNEINTMPGSLAFYLWEKCGYPFPKLVTKLVDLAIEDWKEKKKLVSSFESNILSSFAVNGLKGGKVV